MKSGRRAVFARRERLLRAGGLDIVDTNKSRLYQASHSGAAGYPHRWAPGMLAGGANQLIPDVDFLIAVGGAGNLSGSDGRGEGRERIVETRPGCVRSGANRRHLA